MIRAGLRAHLGHVGERDLLGFGAQGIRQQPDLRGADRDQHRLAGRCALAQERQQTIQVRPFAIVEDGFVVEARGGH